MPEFAHNEWIALIACGGNSTRMGKPKHLLNYHGLPQFEYLFGLLKPMFNETRLSFRHEPGLPESFPILLDHPEIEGPAAAVVTATRIFPNRHILLAGCDYPFIDSNHFATLAKTCETNQCNVAGYNDLSGMYEPLLAAYHSSALLQAEDFLISNNNSLQLWLRHTNAIKYRPGNPHVLRSIDNHEEYCEVKSAFKSSTQTSMHA